MHLGVSSVVVLAAHAPPLILRDTIELQDRKASNFFRVFLEAHANQGSLSACMSVCVCLLRTLLHRQIYQQGLL